MFTFGNAKTFLDEHVAIAPTEQLAPKKLEFRQCNFVTHATPKNACRFAEHHGPEDLAWMAAIGRYVLIYVKRLAIQGVRDALLRQAEGNI